MKMAQHEIEDAADFWQPGAPEYANTRRAARILLALMRWTNSHSDGWPYWDKPGNASRKLQELLQQQYRDCCDDGLVSRAGESGVVEFKDLTDAQLKGALTPIKSFLTRVKRNYPRIGLTDADIEQILTAGIPKPPTTNELISKACHDAGLPVMIQVLGILDDRGHEKYVRSLDADDVEFLYVNYVAPAIDKIEDEIGEPA